MIKVICDTHTNSPNLPTRWCLSKTDWEHLKEASAKRVYIGFLILEQDVIHKHYFNYNFIVLPIENNMTFLTFNRPGKYLITTIIMYCTNPASISPYYLESVLSVWNFLPRDIPNSNILDTNYINGKLHHNVGDDFHVLSNDKEPIYSQFEVEIDNNFFAQKPFDAPWVDLLYEQSSKNQCQLRRRRLWAYTGQLPFIIAFFTICLIARTIFTICFFITGFTRKLNIKNMLDISCGPFHFEHDTIGIENNWILTNKDGELRRLFKIFFSKKQLKPSIFDTELDYLTCHGEQLDANVSSLPRKKRTLKLRYQELKGKLCKPF